MTATPLHGHELASQRVAGDELIVMLRAGHPILRNGHLTLEGYLDSDHIAVTTASELPSDEDLALSRLSRTRRIRMWAQRYAAASIIVSRSDLLLTMPRLYVSVVNTSQNKTVAVPFDVSPMDYYMYWHPSNSLDAGGQWLRRELCRCFSYYTEKSS